MSTRHKKYRFRFRQTLEEIGLWSLILKNLLTLVEIAMKHKGTATHFWDAMSPKSVSPYLYVLPFCPYAHWPSFNDNTLGKRFAKSTSWLTTMRVRPRRAFNSKNNS